MKKVLLVAAFAVSVLGYSQSNDEGTIHINLLGGFAFGGNVTDKATFDGVSEEQKFKFASGTYGLNVHYGLSEKLSVGLGLTTGSYILTPKTLTNIDDIAATTTMSLFNIGAQSRYYLYNEDDMNIYGGVNVGFASATDKFAGFDVTTDSFKASGLSYGINAGINYYIWGNVGGNVQLGYEGAALSGDYKYDGGSTAVKRSVGGINFMAGLAIKIN
ncbi:MAG: outer membrane beta-barrel protein [Bacteroidia bacterium]|nr:outer membrane beta-barrel protein [Bacteroidia bacterium]